METTRKTFGLILTAVWAAVSGVLLVLGSLITLIMLIVSQVPGVDGLILAAIGLLSLAFGIVFLTATYGLWSVQEWGRRAMFWVSAVSIPWETIGILPIVPGQQVTLGNTVLQIVGIGIACVIMLYLSRSQVKALFNGTGT